MKIIINLITASRVVILVILFAKPSGIVLLGIALWGALSDFLDGFLSRRYNLSTNIGANLDQVSDKIFHSVMLVYLFTESKVHFTFLILFFIREVAIVLFRYMNLSSKDSDAAGKIKTVMLYALIISIFVAEIFPVITSVQELLTITMEAIILAFSYVSFLLSVRKKIPRSGL